MRRLASEKPIVGHHLPPQESFWMSVKSSLGKLKKILVHTNRWGMGEMSALILGL